MVKQIRVARSFIASDALAEVIAEDYDFAAPVTCKFFSKMLRTQDNDHYLVNTKEGPTYVARVYQQGDHLGRQESDYQFELDWLNFLKGNDLPVSYPIARRDGRYLGNVFAPEGLRYYALFSLVRGKAMLVKDEEQLYTLGAKMAEIHVVSNNYQEPYRRQAMDLEFLVDRPLARIKRLWGNDRPTELDLIVTSAEEAKDEILAVIHNEEYTEDSWGAIGGDFHPTNTRFDENNQPTFFNFDLCGNGWRAYDIAVFLLNTNLMREPAHLSEAFFAGYYSVRRLSNNEHEAIAPFLTIRRIWLTASFTMNEGIAGHTFIGPV